MSDESRTAATDEPRYTVAELKADARQRVGASRPEIAGAVAMDGSGQKTFTVPQMQRLVERFRAREVQT